MQASFESFLIQNMNNLCIKKGPRCFMFNYAVIYGKKRPCKICIYLINSQHLKSHTKGQKNDTCLFASVLVKTFYYWHRILHFLTQSDKQKKMHKDKSLMSYILLLSHRSFSCTYFFGIILRLFIKNEKKLQNTVKMQNSNFFPTLHWEIAVFNLFILEVKKRVKKMERGEKK